MRKGSGMRDAWRTYLELTLGVTEASKRKAQQVAKKLAGQGGATAAQLQSLAEEVASVRSVNREALTALVRSEIERVLGVMGLARAEQVAELNERVRELERRLAQPQSAAAVAAGGETEAGGVEPALAGLGGAATPSPRQAAKKTAVKKAVAKKAVAKKAVAQEATVEAAGAESTGPETAAPAKAVAKKAAVKKAAVKKAVAKKAVAKKATTAESTTAEAAAAQPAVPEGDGQ